MIKVFASGTANILQTISSGYHKIIPIHSLYFNYVGVNFLGLFNNIKQHIQFIKFIKGDITIPNELLPEFFAAYNVGIDNFSVFDSIDIIPDKINNIKNNFDDCEWFIFEIETLDYYIKTVDEIDYQVSYNFSKDAIKYTQTEEDFINDINILISLIPPNKKILFQTSYNRNDIIYNTLNNNITDNNYYVYEPVYIIYKETYYDNFSYIYSNYLTINDNITETTEPITTTETTDNTNTTTTTTDNTNTTTTTTDNTNTTTTETTDNTTTNETTDNTNTTETTDNANTTETTDNTNTTETTDNTNTTTTDNTNTTTTDNTNTTTTDNTNTTTTDNTTDNTNTTTTTTDNTNTTTN
jgi:hypothetical protein